MQRTNKLIARFFRLVQSPSDKSGNKELINIYPENQTFQYRKGLNVCQSLQKVHTKTI